MKKLICLQIGKEMICEAEKYFSVKNSIVKLYSICKEKI